MAKYWSPTECRYIQHQNKTPILRPSEAVLSTATSSRALAAYCIDIGSMPSRLVDDPTLQVFLSHSYAMG
eukprot:scaffold8341_cov66-Cyclotella_meneghiniana.AAC.3